MRRSAQATEVSQKRITRRALVMGGAKCVGRCVEGDRRLLPPTARLMKRLLGLLLRLATLRRATTQIEQPTPLRREPAGRRLLLRA